MQQLGTTRSSCRRDHFLLTPDTFVRAPLPGMRNATAIVHVCPAMGAAFTQYTVEFESDAAMSTGDAQAVVYVHEGAISIGEHQLTADQYAYLPASADITTAEAARTTVIEKTWIAHNGAHKPQFFIGDERKIAPLPLGDETIGVRQLLPSDMAFDFAVNTMTYEPGASLPMVESHCMEHGCLMLDGGGIYRLNDYWYPVTAGDFIWMGPFCPQWFGCLGKTPARYLIYKDWNRHPLQTR